MAARGRTASGKRTRGGADRVRPSGESGRFEASAGAREEDGVGGAQGDGATRGRMGARPSLYAEVTARIVTELEAGRLPWIKPWDASLCGCGLPENAQSKRRYSGINILILWAAAMDGGFASQRWLTFRQALAAGGHVRKGEQGTAIFYADRFTPQREKDRAEREGGEAGSIAFLKRFTVFNLDQCDGLDGLREADAPADAPAIAPLTEALVEASGAQVRTGGSEACYLPFFDIVEMPPVAAFRSVEDHSATLLHELTHWTGHPSRLARDMAGEFGSPSYAREELVAEMGSAFLCASFGLVPTARHADYLGHWLSVLRADDRAIFRAASAASKASDLLLGFVAEDAGA